MIYLHKRKLRTRRVLLAGAFALLSSGAAGLGAGLWLADDSAELSRLRGRLAALQSEASGQAILACGSPVVESSSEDPELVFVEYQILDTEEAAADYAYLGVSCDRASDPEVDGVPLSHIYVGTPASGAGLESGDIIIAVDGVRTPDYEALKSEIRRRPIGAEATILLRRGDLALQRSLRLASWGAFHPE